MTGHSLNTICIIGIGGAAGEIINFLTRHEIRNIHYLYFDTNLAGLKNCRLKDKYLIEEQTKNDFLVNRSAGKSIIESSAKEIKDLISKNEFIIIISGLGDEVETAWTPVISKLAKDSGRMVFAILIEPLLLKNKRIKNQIRLSFDQIKNMLHTSILIRSDSLLKSDRNKDLITVYNKINQLSLDIILCFKNVLKSGKKFKSEKDELNRILESGYESFSACGIVKRDERCIDVIKRIIKELDPDIINFMSTEGVIIGITGYEYISKIEAALVFHFVRKVFSENTRIFIRNYPDKNLNIRLKVTMIFISVEILK